MHTLILAIFVTATTLLLDVRAKCTQPLYRYITIFFLVAGLGYFFDGMKAEASEIQDYCRYLRSKEEPVMFIIVKDETKKKTKQDLQKDYIEICWQKAHYHYEEGCKCLKEAEEVSLLFPEIPEFDKSKFCLVNIIAGLNPGSPTYRVINITLTVVGQYALMFMDQWNNFKSLLLQSKSHFEMEEHYRMIGKYQYDLYFIDKEEAEKKKNK